MATDSSKSSYYPPNLGGDQAPAAEAQTRELWQNADIFHRSERQREGLPPWVFYEGPPTANGKPGVHHAISRVLKDIFCRYKTMTGHQVLRKGGWDTHGLPVEIEVEKQLGISSKDEVEAYGIEAFNTKCRESVFLYKKEWDDFTQRIGFWVDLDDPYVTYENDYIESVWWLLKQMWDKDLLYRGYKVVPYCGRCETALSSHEVAQGYKDVDDPSVTVKMKAVERDFSLLVWTTTPWTLPSNVAVAVGKNIDYVVVEHEGERLVLAESRVAAYFGDEAPTVVQTMKGADLIGVTYEQLMPLLTPDLPAFRVVPADFVSTEDGTGIVHMAPAYGEDDHRVAQRENLPTLHPVDKSGRFVDELKPYAGLFVKDADKQILRDLKEQGKVFAQSQIHHSYPHCWRCGTPLLYYARDSWYVRTTSIKQQLIEANDDVEWVPAGVGKERFSDWLENNVDWALSRDRFWGTPLPIWECECGERRCIGSRADILEAGGGELDDLHRPFIDGIQLDCPACSKKMKRTPEVIDVWFDSGAMPYAQWHYPFENRERFEQQFPADFISEGIDQTRGWFYSLLAIATMVSGRSSYKHCLTIGLLLDKHGQKMSKTKGNAVDPIQILHEDGADPLRWYLVTVSPSWTPTRFDAEGVKESRRRMIATLDNVYAFFSLYAGLDDYQAKVVTRPADLPHQLDRWLCSRYHTVTAEVREALDGWDATKAGRVLEAFIVDELSNWYVRRSRRRFWKGELDDEKRAAYDTLYTVLDGLARMLAPFTPFLADRLYRALHGLTGLEHRGTDEDSVHLARFPEADPRAALPQLETSMGAVLDIVSLGRGLRSKHGLRVRQPLAEALVYGAREGLEAALADPSYADLVADELNLKQVTWLDDPSRVAKVSAKANFRALGARHGKSTPKVAKVIAGLDAAALGELRSSGSLKLTVEGAEVEIGLDDVFLQEEGLEGYVSESSRDLMVALNLNLDEALRREGLGRELINRIQNLRKDSGLSVSDRIRLFVAGDDEIGEAITEHRERICQETLAVELESDASGDARAEFEIDGHAVTIGLSRVESGGTR